MFGVQCFVQFAGPAYTSFDLVKTSQLGYDRHMAITQITQSGDGFLLPPQQISVGAMTDSPLSHDEFQAWTWVLFSDMENVKNRVAKSLIFVVYWKQNVRKNLLLGVKSL